MAEMTLKIVETAQAGNIVKEPQLVIEEIPPFKPMVDTIWPLVSKHIEELAKNSLGEFELSDVYVNLCENSRTSILIGSMINDQEAYRKGEKVDKKFAGFVVVRMDPPSHSYHIWLVHIQPEFRNTNVFEIGYKWIEENIKKYGFKHVTISAFKDTGIGTLIDKIGFKETFTIYRKELN